MRDRAPFARLARTLLRRGLSTRVVAPDRAALRRGTLLAASAALGVSALAACIDDRGLAPRGGSVRLALRVAVAQTGTLASPNVQAHVFYLRADESRVDLGTIQRSVTAETSSITLPIDIGPCLRDDGRLTQPPDLAAAQQGTDGSAPTCDLEIELTFRDGTTPLDQATVRVAGVRAGETATADGAVRLVAAGTIDVAPTTVIVAVDHPATVTATVRDRDGNPLAGRTVTWSSANTAVTVAPATSQTNGDGVATTTVSTTSATPTGPVAVTATSGVRSGTTQVTVGNVGTLTVAPKDPQPTALVGSSIALTATVLDFAGQPIAGRTVTWTSSNTTVAFPVTATSVTDASGVATVEVRGTFVGSTQIGAESEGLADATALAIRPIVTVLDEQNQWAAYAVNNGGTVVGIGSFDTPGGGGGGGGAYVLQLGGTPQRLDPQNDGAAYDVNASGTVAGSLGFNRAVLFAGERADTLPPLDPNHTFPTNEAFALNDAGDAVGYDLGTDGLITPVLWPSGGGVTAVGPASDDAAAVGVNATRQVVGYTTDIPTDGQTVVDHAFIWTAAAGTQPLGTLGGPNAMAFDINDEGVVVGGSDLPLSGPTPGLRSAFVWRPSTPNGTTGTMTNLGALSPEFPYSEAYAINQEGLIVGVGINLGTTPGEIAGFHGFVWSPSAPGSTTGAMVDLGGGTYSWALDINDRGQVVGFALSEDQQSFHPILWTIRAEGVGGQVLTARDAAAQVVAQQRMLDARLGSGRRAGLAAPPRRLDAGRASDLVARVRAARAGRPGRAGAAALRGGAR